MKPTLGQLTWTSISDSTNLLFSGMDMNDCTNEMYGATQLGVYGSLSSSDGVWNSVSAAGSNIHSITHICPDTFLLGTDEGVSFYDELVLSTDFPVIQMESDQDGAVYCLDQRNLYYSSNKFDWVTLFSLNDGSSNFTAVKLVPGGGMYALAAGSGSESENAGLWFSTNRDSVWVHLGFNDEVLSSIEITPWGHIILGSRGNHNYGTGGLIVSEGGGGSWQKYALVEGSSTNFLLKPIQILSFPVYNGLFIISHPQNMSNAGIYQMNGQYTNWTRIELPIPMEPFRMMTPYLQHMIVSGEYRGNYALYMSENEIFDTSEGQRVFGDVDHNWSLDVADVVQLLQIVSLLVELPESDSWVADLNFDGQLDVSDVVLLLELILELP